MLTLKENENMIVDDFLPENAMSNWNNYINGEGIPMFYAPHSINNNTTNDDYFFHIGYQGTVPQSNVYECFLENFAGIAGLRFDALAHIKISWYPKTIKIHEYETVSETKGVVDNLIYFSDTTDGYIMLPNDVKIQSVKNIQCYLNETPVSQGKIITY
jgi:hypothetical protein